MQINNKAFNQQWPRGRVNLSPEWQIVGPKICQSVPNLIRNADLNSCAQPINEVDGVTIIGQDASKERIIFAYLCAPAHARSDWDSSDCIYIYINNNCVLALHERTNFGPTSRSPPRDVFFLFL